MQFIRKTSSRQNILGLIIKLTFATVLVFGIVFLLNKIDFPAPKKEIEKIIPKITIKNILNFIISPRILLP